MAEHVTTVCDRSEAASASELAKTRGSSIRETARRENEERETARRTVRSGKLGREQIRARTP
eukprot:scaffold114153_cov69-Phaeocystis_antarctica.AAC.3